MAGILNTAWDNFVNRWVAEVDLAWVTSSSKWASPGSMDTLPESAEACRNPLNYLGASCSFWVPYLSFCRQRASADEPVLILCVVRLHHDFWDAHNLFHAFRVGTELQKWRCLNLLLNK